MQKQDKEKLVAIFSGTFDPIHIGHLRFAIEAVKSQKLDALYFLPERIPRQKDATHYAHRMAMVKLAIKPYSRLKTVEIEDRQFSVNRTMPKIEKLTNGAKIYFLMGSDQIKNIKHWPNYQKFLQAVHPIILLRNSDSESQVKLATKSWPNQPVVLNKKHSKYISSSKIRESLLANKPVSGLLASTKKYIKDNWLYISLDNRLS